MRVPFLDLKPQYDSIKDDIKGAVERVLESQQFILGPAVDKFEREMAEYMKVPHAIGVASGTDALLLSLMSIDLKAGDSVITTPFTFFATAGSISRLQATPLFIDIDPLTYTIDPYKIEEGIKRRGNNQQPKAIIPVHLYGQCADMSPIMEIARQYNLLVIEDAAQAVGAEYLDQVPDRITSINGVSESKRAGTMGDLGCLSFFPSKNLGGFGDGGMIVTNNHELSEKISILRVHGSKIRNRHKIIGCNSRLDSLQAAILSIKLKHLDRWIKKRQIKAEFYKELFMKKGIAEKPGKEGPGEGEVVLPHIRNNCFHTFNYFVIRVKERDRLGEYLKKMGIETQAYYPIPLHLQDCYAKLGYKKGDFPVAERLAGEVLALPIYPELKKEMQEYTVEKIETFFTKKR